MLEAASARFASIGFAATTVRAVAADAGVDPSQVIQFFGSKERLFAAVMTVPASALERYDTAFNGPVEGAGERIVAAFLDTWEGATDEAEPLMATLRGAIVHDGAAAQLREFIQSRWTGFSNASDDPDAALRAGLVSSMLVGLITARDVIGVPAVRDATRSELIERLAPLVQDLLHPGTTVSG